MGKNTLMELYGCGVMHTKDNIFKIIVPQAILTQLLCINILKH